MCKELCESREDGSMISCPDCGRLICWDILVGDDVLRPAYVTESGDLYCDQCGRGHQAADQADEEAWADWEAEQGP